MFDREDVLRHLTLGDTAHLDALVAARHTGPGDMALSAPCAALVTLGALAASGASDLTWQRAVSTALIAGVTADEVVDALVVLAPVIGHARVVAIAPKVALALGYDVEAALEAR